MNDSDKPRPTADLIGFTPGPWTFDTEAIGGASIMGCQGPLTVCVARAHGQPDARLIAAAPDLLAALTLLAEIAQGFNVSGVYFSETEGEALAQAWAAIAKATGAA